MQLKTNYSFNNHSYLIHRQSKANISKYLLSSSCRAVRAESCVCLFPTTVASPTPPPPYMKHYNFAGTGARVLAAVSTQSRYPPTLAEDYPRQREEFLHF